MSKPDNLLKRVKRASKMLNVELNNSSYNPKRTLLVLIAAMKEAGSEDPEQG